MLAGDATSRYAASIEKSTVVLTVRPPASVYPETVPREASLTSDPAIAMTIAFAVCVTIAGGFGFVPVVGPSATGVWSLTSSEHPLQTIAEYAVA